MVRPYLTLVLAVNALAACNDKLGPADPGGRWLVRASYAGGTVQCRVDATLEFPLDPTTGPGSYQEERVDCTDARVPVTNPLQSYTVVHSLADRSIIFVPYRDTNSCAVLRFEGQLGDDSMGGTVATMVWNCVTYLQMQGTWRARRVD